MSRVGSVRGVYLGYVGGRYSEGWQSFNPFPCFQPLTTLDQEPRFEVGVLRPGVMALAGSISVFGAWAGAEDSIKAGTWHIA